MVDDQIEKQEKVQNQDVTEISHLVGRWLKQEIQTPLNEMEKILESKSLEAETDTRLKGFIGKLRPSLDKTNGLMDSFENSKEVLVKPKGDGIRFEVQFSKEIIPVPFKPGKVLVEGEDAARFIDAFSDSIGNALGPLQWASVVAARTEHSHIKSSMKKIEALANQINDVIYPLRNASTFEIRTDEGGKVTIETYKKPLESL